jgi:hypothetical protein
MDRTGENLVKQYKPDPERQVLHVFSHMCNLGEQKKDMKVEWGLFGKRKGTREKGGHGRG